MLSECGPFARIGTEDLGRIRDYLAAYAHENILLLSDLLKMTSAWASPETRSRGLGMATDQDPVSMIAYCQANRLVAAQGFYRHGRWLPHFVDARVIDTMIEDMLPRRVRWLMGVSRVVDPILTQLRGLGYGVSYDEQDHQCYVDQSHFRPCPQHGTRRATMADVPALAGLRRDFEHEYFGIPLSMVDAQWCAALARQYVAQGAYLVHRGEQVVSMVAVEARIPGITQIGAVYTKPQHRGLGLAKGVVSAICSQELSPGTRVTLTVRVDNEPAQRAYNSLGFQFWDRYRMLRLGQP